jgi:hypothetical protein
MNKFLLFTLLSTVFCVFVAGQDQPSFDKWKEQNKKTYPNAATEAAAKKNYEKNAAAVNANNKNPKSTYKQKVHAKSDKSEEELSKKRDHYSIEKEKKEVAKENPKKVKSSGARKADSWAEKMKKSAADNEKRDEASIPASLDYSG